LAEDDLVSRQAQSAIFGCSKDQQINLSAKKSATPMPRRNNFQRDNFSIATAFVSVSQRLHGRRSRLPSQPGACREDNKWNGQRNPDRPHQMPL